MFSYDNGALSNGRALTFIIDKPSLLFLNFLMVHFPLFVIKL